MQTSESIPFELNTNKKGFVFIAFIEQCPILRKNYGEFEKTKNQFPHFDFYYVGKLDAASRTELKKYQLTLNFLNDPNYKLLKKLNLKISGQSAVFVKQDTKLIKVYTGAINDQYSFDHSKKKQINNFLNDALESIENKKEIKIRETPTPGCILNINE